MDHRDIALAELALDERAALDLAGGYRAVARAALAQLAATTRRERRLMARVRELLDALRAEREARAEVERELRWLRAQLVRHDEEAA